MQNILPAIFFSSCIIVLFRLFSVFRINNMQAITVNYAIAATLSLLSYGEWVSPSLIADRPWFIWSVINGILFILVFMIFAFSAQKAGVAITSVSSKMSVIIPVSIGIFFYNDTLNIFKILGIILAFPAFYLIFHKDKKEKIQLEWIILPILLFLGTGTNDSIMKHARMYSVGDEYLLFLGTIFFIALITGLLITSIILFTRKGKITLPDIAGGAILGLLNYLSTMYFLKSVAIIESSVFFPIFNVSIISMGALVGYFIFKEKLSRINWTGIFVAAITILMIALA